MLVVFCLFNLSGQSIFQQVVDHNLKIEIDDIRHVITGNDSIIYFNNSPDSLNSLFFHLWPNAYQPGSTLSELMLAQGDSRIHYSRKDHQGNISGLVFRVNGTAVRWEPHPLHNDICRIDLPVALMPDSMISINVMFRVSIPGHGAGTMGRNGQSYFLSNWYPRPAVYDNTGWQLAPLIPRGGTPGEYGSYQVQITLPRNYVVASSGKLDFDPDEEKWMENIDEKTRRINRWGRRESAGFPASAGKTKTLTFTQNNANDFVICFDKRFNYLADTLHIPGLDRYIDIQLFFTVIEGAYWSGSMDMVKRALRFMIENAGDYPFDSFSVVQTTWHDGSDVHPALVRIGTAMSPYLLESEIISAVADHWFSSAVAFNACQDPWITKGLAGSFAMRYIRGLYHDSLTLQDVVLDPGVKRNLGGLRDHPVTWFEQLKMSFLQEDELQPANLQANQFTPNNFISTAELKSAFAFLTLYESIGHDKFNQLIKDFYYKWKGKRPTVNDFMQALKVTAGEEVVNWFFNELIRKNEWPDYRITSSKITDEGHLITVKNISGVVVPYTITASSPDGEKVIRVDGHPESFEIQYSDTGHAVTRFTLDKDFVLPELNRNDNTIRTKGVFRGVNPLSVKPVVALPDPYKSQITFSPVAGWNSTNGFMAGLAVYSNPIIIPATEYLVMPLYGTKNRDLAGLARIEHHFMPSQGRFSRISFGAEVKRYGYETANRIKDEEELFLLYQRLMPFAEFQFRKSDPLQTKQHRIKIRSVLISKYFSSPAIPGVLGDPNRYYVNEIKYLYRNSSIINPFRMHVSLQQSKNMLRVFSEENWFINYPSQGKGFSIRTFAGLFLITPSNKNSVDFRFTPSGVAINTSTRFDQQDPLFDHLYLARNNVNGILKQHMYLSHGGFKRITTVGNTWRWMLAVNMETTLPGRLPFQLYMDAGIFADDTKDKYTAGKFLYASGVKVTLIKGVAAIYLPFTFLESAEIAEREEMNKLELNYFQKIRFVFNLNQLNPLTIPKKIRF